MTTYNQQLLNNKENLKKIVGVGWNFPIRFSQTGGILKVGDTDQLDSIEVVRQSIRILLITRLGERFIRRNFGSPLEEMLYEPLDPATLSELKEAVLDTIIRFEKRVSLINVQTITDASQPGLVELHIDFLVNRTNQAGNLVYPLYLKGT